jgi:myo-inositol-1(or 4)-monophosphatase
MDDARLMDVLRSAGEAVRSSLATVTDWGPSGLRRGQYAADLVADAAACEVLLDAGLGVFSEESGATETGRDVVVVVDPIDGSTNAAHRLPWFSTSLCALDEAGARAALVVNQATGVRFEACRGGGATRDGSPIAPSSCTAVADAVVAVTGRPRSHGGWSQFRALGACSLDLCAVADGTLDGYLTVGRSGVFPWDYLGALLVCREAGASVAERDGAELVVCAESRKHPVGAATAQLAEELLRIEV